MDHSTFTYPEPILAELIQKMNEAQRNQHGNELDEKTQAQLMYGLRFILVYLREALLFDRPSLFIDNVRWYQQYMLGTYLAESNLIHYLQMMRSLLDQHMIVRDTTKASLYLEQAIQFLNEQYNPETTSFLKSSQPMYQEASQYLKYLLDGDRNQSFEIISTLWKRGTPIRDIYEYILQPVQWEVGLLWQTHEITIAQEHFCTNVTKSIMEWLLLDCYPPEDETQGVFIGVCVGNELHDVGIRMVTDFFSLDGWVTHYLGANTPHDEIVESIVRFHASVVGISVTMPFHVHLAQEVIEKIRSHSEARSVYILVGGYAFNRETSLWEDIGADGFAPSAKAALEMANTR
jgi:MerR family transcriptional regulator, light-induced transcriptional regulator